MLPSFLPSSSFQWNKGSLFRYRKITWGSEQMTPRVNTGISSMHFYFHVKISENTAKQIITAFHFCVFLKLFHHNATQMLVGLGYLLKRKQCLWSPRTCLWTQMKKNCVQLASVSTSQGILKFMTGIRIVPSPNDCRITSWY